MTTLEVPFPRSYWVVTGELLAGCYPGDKDPYEAQLKLKGLIDSGIRHIVNLMKESEVSHDGHLFVPYQELLARIATNLDLNVTYIRLPIKDTSVPTKETMSAIISEISKAINDGRPVYLHCWGGRGRTGTVVGCYLVHRGIAATGQHALEMIQYLRRKEPTAYKPSPENDLQRTMVKSWRQEVMKTTKNITQTTYFKALEATYYKLRNIVGSKIEPFEVVSKVQEYREYWKPEKVRVALLAESHVWTGEEEYGCRLDQTQINLHSYSENFVRFVYCLGYGENDLLLKELKIKNSGTPEFWKIFFSCLHSVSSNNDFNPILKKSGRLKERIENKIRLLQEMKKQGIWLLDASILGLYTPGGKKSYNLKTHDQIILHSFDLYIEKILTDLSPEHVICIGKGVYNVLKNHLDNQFGNNMTVVELPGAFISAEKKIENFKKYFKICNKHCNLSATHNLITRRTFEHYAGCLLGGAIGDAMGAPVEFMNIKEIRKQFGDGGIKEFLESYGKKGTITDDTQMTLFTAEGLLRAYLRWTFKGIGPAYAPVVYHAYIRWLHTQGENSRNMDFDNNNLSEDKRNDGWLIKVSELHDRRSPGITCLTSLKNGLMGTIHKSINQSKGCGGVMRVAPVGLFLAQESANTECIDEKYLNDVFDLGCEIAALTHGHPTGYLTAGCFSTIIYMIVSGLSLNESINEALSILKTRQHHEECSEAINLALSYASDKTIKPSSEIVELIGAGWVAEEAVAISIYCALAADDDFKKGVRLAVNHSGDSDSTGAMTGNILGALLGKHGLPFKWLRQLELRYVIEEIAQDLINRIVYEEQTQINILEPRWAKKAWAEKYPPW